METLEELKTQLELTKLQAEVERARVDVANYKAQRLDLEKNVAEKEAVDKEEEVV